MKALVTIIVIIIIVAVAFLLLRNGTVDDSDMTTDKTTTEESVGDSEDTNTGVGDAVIDTTPEIIVVTYTNTGFDPSTVTVSAGQTVRFVNEGSGNMWVASNNHPTHTLLSEFDQKSTGDVYEFAFTDAGSWGYHNHVNPTKRGTVVVE